MIDRDITQALQGHLAVCREMLALLERENRFLRHGNDSGEDNFNAGRRELSQLLQQSLADLKRQRLTWSKLSPAERKDFPEVPGLIQQCQTLILRLVTLDRENEQTRLKRGLLPGAAGAPVNRQRPHFVSELYRRNAL